jgi:hypothetical protein
MPHVLVWDIETVPDLAGYAAANGHDGKSDDEIRRGGIADENDVKQDSARSCIGG